MPRLRLRPRRFNRLLPAFLIAGALAPAEASALPAEGPIFTTTGEDCRNFTVSLDGSIDPAVARELTPKRFELTDPPSGFVEMAKCPGGTVNGAEIGPYTIAEAAIAIEPPADIGGTAGVIEQDIFALSQLDTNATLSRVKSEAGYPSEVLDIGFDYTPGPPQRIEGTIPWSYSPYTMSATLAGGVPLPGVNLVTRIWTAGPKGVIVTENNIHEIAAGSTGFSTASFEPGSPLAELAGAETVTGPSISGVGTFENRAYLIEEGARLRARSIKGGKGVRVTVTGAEGPFAGTVRRGRGDAGRRVKSLRARGNRIVWVGKGRSGRRAAPGRYTVGVSLKDSGQELGSVAVKLTRKGLRVR